MKRLRRVVAKGESCSPVPIFAPSCQSKDAPPWAVKACRRVLRGRVVSGVVGKPSDVEASLPLRGRAHRRRSVRRDRGRSALQEGWNFERGDLALDVPLLFGRRG